MKAFILAAGLGERLRPLTLTTPKPLVQVGEYKLIEYHLYNLAKIGVTEVVINVCHLPEQIMSYLGEGKRYGLQISYLVEQGKPLGTVAGVVNGLDYFDDQPFILLSADVWTAYDLSQLPTELGENLAHIVLIDDQDQRACFGLNDQGEVIETKSTQLSYAGIGVLHPTLFADVNDPATGFKSTFLKAIASGRLHGECCQEAWFNVGTEVDLAAVRTYIES